MSERVGGRTRTSAALAAEGGATGGVQRGLCPCAFLQMRLTGRPPARSRRLTTTTMVVVVVESQASFAISVPSIPPCSPLGGNEDHAMKQSEVPFDG